MRRQVLIISHGVTPYKTEPKQNGFRFVPSHLVGFYDVLPDAIASTGGELRPTNATAATAFGAIAIIVTPEAADVSSRIPLMPTRSLIETRRAAQSERTARHLLFLLVPAFYK